MRVVAPVGVVCLTLLALVALSGTRVETVLAQDAPAGPKTVTVPDAVADATSGKDTLSYDQAMLAAGAITALAKSKTLKSLTLRGCMLVDSELAEFGKEARLTSLDLTGSTVQQVPAGNAKWPLTRLVLRDCAVADTKEGAAALALYTSLTELDLSGTPAAEQLLGVLRKLPALTVLRLSDTAGKRPTAEWLPASLKELEMAGVELATAQVALIPKSCPSLTRLDLSGCRIGKDSGVYLGRIATLKQLDLRSSDFPEDKLAALRKALANAEVLTGPHPDRGLASRLKGLRSARTAHDVRVQAALQWLADHQARDGSWSPVDFATDSVRTSIGAKSTGIVDFREDIEFMLGTATDKGVDDNRVGLTGLALLAFTSDGQTHKRGFHSKAIQRALTWLVKQQDNEGCFGSRDEEEYVYGHAIATIAVCELLEMSGDNSLQPPAQNAVNFVLKAQNPGMGWRYGVRATDNDTSVTAWMTHAVKAGESAGLAGAFRPAYDGAAAWVKKADGVNKEGARSIGYNRPGGVNARPPHGQKYRPNGTLDACGWLIKDAAKAQDAAAFRKDRLDPLLGEAEISWADKSDGGPWLIDMYFWMHAGLAAYRGSDAVWKSWSGRLFEPVLLKQQRGYHAKDVKAFGAGVIASSHTGSGDSRTEVEKPGRWLLDEHGSWDPVDPWGSAGGRVYATAMGVLCLNAHRYGK